MKVYFVAAGIAHITQPLDSQRSEALHPLTLRHHHRRHPPSHWMKNPTKNWTGMTFCIKKLPKQANF